MTAAEPMSITAWHTADGAPLRACLLSGGASRRMGSDKALLAHPSGGTWLERGLELLAGLNMPVTLLSRYPRHLALAESLQRDLDPTTAAPITAVAEPPPWDGPLLALQRLMELHADERLLLCPVDMPLLSAEGLQLLVRAAAEQPGVIHVAHDGERLQPLLGVYPTEASLRNSLDAAIASGERRLQRWLADQPYREMRLDPLELSNLNLPEDLASIRDRGLMLEPEHAAC